MKIKKYVGISLTGVLLMIGSLSVHAEDTVLKDNGTASMSVGYHEAIDYSVSIPKYVELDKSKQCSYEISVTATEIDNNHKISVTPTDVLEGVDGINFEMGNTSGRKVIATVTQGDTVWYGSEVLDKEVKKSGTISAPDLGPGDWSGSLVFNIVAEEHVHNFVDSVCTECGFVNQQQAYINLSTDSVSLTYPETKTITVDTNSNVPITAQSNNERAVKVSVSGNVVTIAPVAQGMGISTTVIISCAESNGYTAVSKTVNVSTTSGTLTATEPEKTADEWGEMGHNLTYTGYAQQVPIPTSSVLGSKISYYIVDLASTNGAGLPLYLNTITNWSTVIPTVTSAGRYDLAYKIEAPGYNTLYGSYEVKVNSQFVAMPAELTSMDRVSLSVGETKTYTLPSNSYGIQYSYSSYNTSALQVSVSGNTLTLKALAKPSSGRMVMVSVNGYSSQSNIYDRPDYKYKSKTMYIYIN